MKAWTRRGRVPEKNRSRAMARKALVCVGGWFVMALCECASHGAVIRVLPGGDDDAIGGDWASAKATIAGALSAAVAGDELWVAAGTYAGTVTLVDGVAVYGGFAGGEATRDERDWKANLTVVSGDDSIRCVVVPSGAGPGCVVDGVSIVDGRAGDGGGVYSVDASPTFRHCTISSCYVTGSGSGLYFYGGAPTISECLIVNNQARGPGGGIYARESTLTLNGCTLSENRGSDGAGVYVYYAEANVENCRFVDNAATRDGGGICASSGNITVTGSVLWANSAARYGGALSLAYSEAVLANVTVAANAAITGGALACTSTNTVTLANSIVAHNVPGISAGSYTAVTWTRRNNCVYGNLPYDWKNADDPAGTNGNVSADPMFADRLAGDFHLRPGSPCIDTGDDALAGTGELDGQARIIGAHVDMGVDESDGSDWPEPVRRILRVRPDGDDASDGSTWELAMATVDGALAAAAPGDEVWVQEGVYHEAITLPASVALYGGFAGTEDAREQRDWETHVSELNGDGQNSIATFPPNAGRETVVDGFTIRNGYGWSGGGGVLCSTGAAVISHCIIDECRSRDYGGGMHVIGGYPLVQSCTFTRNNGVQGGGLSAYSAVVTVTGCMFSENSANRGGGVYTSGGRVEVHGGRFQDNRATSQGGAVYGLTGEVALFGTTLFRNGAGDAGGGLWAHNYYGESISVWVINATIVRNISRSGGAVHVGGAQHLTLANTVIAENTSGIYLSGLSQNEGTPVIQNNCVWQNGDADWDNWPDPAGTDGNIAQDPHLADALMGNLHIQPDSPCRDAGNSALGQDVPEMDNQPRIQGVAVDIGADECDGTQYPDPVRRTWYVRTDGDDAEDGQTWDTAKATPAAALALAGPGDSVFLASGTYTGTLVVDDAVTIQGGIAVGTREGPTLLDGAGAGPVVTFAPLGSSGAVLDSVTVCNGEASEGGGIYAELGSVTVKHCTVRDCTASNSGGGAYFEYAKGRFEGCTFSANAAGGSGGAAALWSAEGTFVDCVLDGNTAQRGGGAYTYSLSTTWQRCVFDSNEALGVGGGLFASNGITDIANSVFVDNVAAQYGGGIEGESNVGATYLNVLNCVFARNRAPDGGAVACYGVHATVANCMLGWNDSGIWDRQSKSAWAVRNNCFHENTGYDWKDLSTVPAPEHANFSEDPLFVDPAGNDFHLLPGSPCINAGANEFAPEGDDIDGEDRIAIGIVDVGVDEVPVSADTGPPNTLLVSGPAPGSPACEMPTIFGFVGTDDLTPPGQLQFAWQLDGGGWSGWSPDTHTEFADIAEGDHLFEVKARDITDKEDSTPAASAFRVDFSPPLISNVSFAPQVTNASVSWQTDEPATSTVLYRIGDGPETSVSNGDFVTGHQVMLMGLLNGTTYNVRVQSRDLCNRESESVGHTFDTTVLQHPESVTVQPFSGRIEISWSGGEPVDSVAHYAVYVEGADFGSIEGLTPRLTTTATSCGLAGLANGVPVYVAVASVDSSGGRQQAVSAVQTTPTPDTEGPVIESILVNGQPLGERLVLTTGCEVAVTATDPSGVATVELLIDGTMHSRGTGTPPVLFNWDLRSAADGEHLIAARATDSVGNISSTAPVPVIVQLAIPPAPAITSPPAGTVLSRPLAHVRGTAARADEVRALLNGEAVADWRPVGADGTFRFGIPLASGLNAVQAVTRNRAGEGPWSSPLALTYDTESPLPPEALVASSRPAGVVRLRWWVSSEVRSDGCHVYRAAPGRSRDDAVRITAAPVPGTSYEDTPPADGIYTYWVSVVDMAGRESRFSDAATGISDRVAPSVTLSATPRGAFDPAAGRVGVGSVDVVVTADAELPDTPYLALHPAGGVPAVIALRRYSETEFSGSVMVTDDMPSGQAAFLISARDDAGNRATEVGGDAALLLDTDGPSVTAVAVVPQAPIQASNPAPVEIAVTVDVDEAIQSGTIPDLTYVLSGEGRVPEPVANLARVETREAERWQGSFVLPVDAGETYTETLSFSWHAVDDLGNESTRIRGPNAFQVYQGELPPLAPPLSVTGTARPAGAVQLTWSAVGQASGYAVWRQTAGEDALTRLTETDSANTQWNDTPPVDGPTTYAVTTLREANGQTAESDLSDAVVVDADRVAPDPPTGLQGELQPRGIVLSWEVPVRDDLLTYRVYRSADDPISSVEGLTPILTDVYGQAAVDPTPSPDEHAYAVTAVDSAGNESQVSSSVYLNFGLLPVTSLVVTQTDDLAPVLSWARPPGVVGASISVNGQVVSGGAVAVLSWTDSGWSGGDRTYTVTPLDEQGVSGPSRSVMLPALEVSLCPDEVIRRRVMNRVCFRASNLSHAEVADAVLEFVYGTRDAVSSPFGMAPGEEAEVEITVPGLPDLPDEAAGSVTARITYDGGERAEVVRSVSVPVEEGMLVATILNEPLVRGGSAEIRFSLVNSGEDTVEIVTDGSLAETAGVTVDLLGTDGSLLSFVPFRQQVGEAVVTLAGGVTVARIGPGREFVSAACTLAVPEAAPDNGVLRLTIGGLYHGLGTPQEVALPGMACRKSVTLEHTAYSGLVYSAEPDGEATHRQVLIKGRAVEQDGRAAVPGVQLLLCVTHSGFERTWIVVTGEDGTFTHVFEVPEEEFGRYSVCAVHPDVSARPVQAEFVLAGVSLSPTRYRVSAPRNYRQELTIRVTAGEGSELDNLVIAYAAEYQPGGALPEGVHVVPGPAVAQLSGGQSAVLTCDVWADNMAADTAEFQLAVLSGSRAELRGLVSVTAEFSQAVPMLDWQPAVPQLGVQLGTVGNAEVVLTNEGMAELIGLALELRSLDGAAAPAWMRLASASGAASLGVGEDMSVNVQAAPPQSVRAGLYSFLLVVTAANAPRTEIPMYATVTESGAGDLLVKVSDIYTATVDPEDGSVIQGLAGAHVLLQSERVPTIEMDGTTDAAGEVLFEDLPAGPYRCRVSAARHQSHTARVWVRPGLTGTEDVFLDYNLVTVEWQVVETTIEDRYEVVLNATYETDVPAAVVVAEPASFTVPDLGPGDVFRGEFTLTNYGLIRADDLQVLMPAFRYQRLELGRRIPDHLDAMQRLTIPFRITKVAQPEGARAGLKDEGCVRFKTAMVCSNGTQTEPREGQICFYAASEGSGEGGGKESAQRVANATKKKKSSMAPSGNGKLNLPGVICVPVIYDVEVEEEFIKTAGKRFVDALCSVDALLGTFRDEQTDLAVKVPNGALQIRRVFNGTTWTWDRIDDRLTIVQNGLGDVQAVVRQGAIYEQSGTGEGGEGTVYLSRGRKIEKIPAGYRWEDGRLQWETYDLFGRMTGWGVRDRTVGKLVYPPIEWRERPTEIIHLKPPTAMADAFDVERIALNFDDDGKLRTASDTSGRTVTYEYEGAHLSRCVDVTGKAETWGYDEFGRLIREADAFGRVAHITYEAEAPDAPPPGGGRQGEPGLVLADLKPISHRVTSILDDQGRGFHYRYDYDPVRREYYIAIESADGNVKEQWFTHDGRIRRIDFNGRTINYYAWDGDDMILTDERGISVRTDYDQWGNVTAIQHETEGTITFTYAQPGSLLTKVVDPRGKVITLDYDDRGNVTVMRQGVDTPEEGLVRYEYDDRNRLVTLRMGEDQDHGPVYTYTYDNDDNLLAVAGTDGRSTSWGDFTPWGQPRTYTDTESKTWTYSYDNLGRPLGVQTPATESVSMEYNDLGLPERVTDSSGMAVEAVYTPEGMLKQLSGPEGVQSTIEYNDDMRPARMTDATGRETLYEYDEFGRVTAYTDALGRRTVLSYELEPGDKAELQRPSAIITPDGVTTQLVYDDAGRLVERIAVAPNGARTARRFVYDSVGNITSMTDEDGNTVELEYDAYGRPTSIRDAANGLATFEYNSAGFCTAVAGPDGGRTSMTYDTVGRMQSVTLPEGRTAQFEYDAADRISAVDAGDGTRVEYDHDADGNVTATSIIDSRTRESLSYSYGFNASDNLTSWSDGTVSATITYDGLGRRTGRTVDYGAFEAGYTYSFDSVGSVATFQGPGGMSHTVSADSLGRFAAMEIAGAGVVHCAGHTASGPKGLGLPGGSAQTLVYDEFGRLTGVIWRDPAGNTLFERECLLSPTGMVTVERRESGTVAYEYNAVNFLAEVDVGGDDGVTAYSYDSRGNRLTGPGWIGDATYDRESRLLTAGILEFQCDESGNCSRRTDGVHTVDYVYDPDNRLVRIDEDGETIAEYGYDPFGLRIWKEVAGVRTYYLYCDEGLLAELDATGTVLRTYGYLPSGVFGAPPLYVREGDAVYWVHSDRIGRPLRMTDTSGRVVWSAEYDAFGAAQIDVDEVTLNLRLPGQYYDAETGLHYNGLRYYDPSLGRYLQKDPLGAEGNAYAYAENNPLGQVDPTGGFSGPRMIADEYNKNLQFHGGNHLFAFFETFSPITWFCRDLQESVTGVGFRHDNKGRPLSNLERGLAMVGVATVVVPFAGKAVSLGAKGLHKGIQLGRVGVQEAGALTRNGARQQAQQMLRKETRMRTAGQFMKKGQLTEHELKELQGIAGKYGDFGISGSLAETELGLVNRTHLLSRLKMYFNKDNRWRAVKARSNLNTGKKLDLDVVIMPRESTVTKPRALQEELQKLFPGFEIDVKYSVFNQTMAAAEKWGTPMIYFKDGGYSRVAAPWQAENYWPW